MTRQFVIWHDDEAHTTDERLTAIYLAFHWSKAGQRVTMTSFTA